MKASNSEWVGQEIAEGRYKILGTDRPGKHGAHLLCLRPPSGYRRGSQVSRSPASRGRTTGVSGPLRHRDPVAGGAESSAHRQDHRRRRIPGSAVRGDAVPRRRKPQGSDSQGATRRARADASGLAAGTGCRTSPGRSISFIPRTTSIATSSRPTSSSIATATRFWATSASSRRSLPKRPTGRATP